MRRDPVDPQAQLPLTPTVYQILLALADGERHGYAIRQEIAAVTNGQIRIGPGNLYRALRGLDEQGLVEESEERPDPPADDARRRYYRLTAYGQAVLIAETHRLTQVLNVARSRAVLRPLFEGQLALGDEGC
jgi:DNA-binding PadR family transcriptional regulator